MDHHLSVLTVATVFGFRIFFASSAPCGPTGGEWDYGTTEQRNRSTPVPGQTPLPQSLMGQRRGAQRLKDALPKPQSQSLSRGEQPEDAWEVGIALAADQQADPRGTGLRGRGRRWLPRTGLRYFISSLRNPAKSSYASLQCVAFSCLFFFIIKEGVKLARSPLHPLSQKEPNGYEKGGKKERTHTPISEGMPVRCGLYLNIQYVNGRGVGTYIKCRLHLIAPRSQL